jgi:hypothetical protein
MKRLMGTRGIAALIVSVIALVVAAAGTSSATPGVHRATKTTVHRATRASAGPVTKTFSFIAKPGSNTVVVVNIDDLLINARCGKGGNPVIFAFSGAAKADIFGRIFDGMGRLHTIHNTSFTKASKASVQLSTSSGDFDASGTVLFETSTGKVVTVQYAFDNATTLAKTNVCTVFGSVVAS